MKKDTTTPPDELGAAPCSTFVFIDARLSGGRLIRAEHGGGMFRFVFTEGRKSRKIEITEDEARILGRMISAMSPDTTASTDPLWSEVQRQRERLKANVKDQPTARRGL